MHVGTFSAYSRVFDTCLSAKTPYLIGDGTFAYTLGYTPALKIAIKITTAPNINHSREVSAKSHRRSMP